jgi:hypothetical protein
MTAKQECKDCNKSLEGCKCIEDTIEFTEADIETFIDWVFNPAEPNQALKEAAERYQERNYSEEEVIAFGEFIFKHTLLAHSKGVKNLFEQFKKK